MTPSPETAARLRAALETYDMDAGTVDDQREAVSELAEYVRQLLEDEGPALSIPIASPSGTYGPWLVQANYTHQGDVWTSSGQLPSLIVPSWLGLRETGVEPYMRRLVNPTEDERLTVHVGLSGDVDYV